MGTKSKRLTINLVSQLIAFAVSIGVSFFLTPYVTDKLGKEVYGFVGMAYQVTSYISMFTVAFNAMLNIFVATEYHKNDEKKANEYYSSVLAADTILSIILFIPLMLIVFFMDKLLDVPSASVNDIKMLWGIIFMTFLLQLATGPFGVGFFIANRLDISAKRGITTNVIKAMILLGTFCLFVPRVWYVGLASFVCALYSVLVTYKYKRIFVPNIKFEKELFRFSAIKELLSVGIWNTINQLTNILLNGLDLIITNLYISALAMGYISYAQTFPIQFGNLIVTISGTFTPVLTKVFAQGKQKEFNKELGLAVKICGYLCSVPLVGFIIFGSSFYKLWLPTLTVEEVKTINHLSWLILVPTFFSVYTFSLNTVQTITKKIKIPVIFSFTISVINIVMELLLLKYTNLGVYAIEIATAVVLGIRNVVFIPLYTAHNLHEKWYKFYPMLVRGFLSSTIVLVIFYFIGTKVIIDCWSKLIVMAMLVGILGYILAFLLLFNSSEKKKVLDKILSRFKH